MEHICLEAGCWVVLNPVGLFARIHNLHTADQLSPSPTLSLFLSLSSSFVPPLILHHQTVVLRLSFEGRREFSLCLSFHRDTRPARIRLDAPLKDARISQRTP